MNIKRFAFITTVTLLGLVVASLWWLALSIHAAQPNSLTVCPAGPPDCDHVQIQDAVDAASDGDIIKVAAGLYSDLHVRPRRDLTTTGVVTQVVYISKTVTLRGGYTAPDFAEPPDPEANPATLDAQGQGRVLYITGAISPTIEGLRITGGDADGLEGYIEPWSWQDTGGGVYAITATVTIRNSRVFSNTSDLGGGLYFYQCNATALIDNAITSNFVDPFGDRGVGAGMLLNQCSDVILSSNNISANVASCCGGGLALLRSNAALTGNSISGNSAISYGGGLHSAHCTIQVDRNSMISNTANLGGGMYIYNSDVIVINSIISENQANSAGGGLYVLASQSRLKHTTIVHNSSLDGAGLYVVNGPKPPSNSLVALTNTMLLSHTVAITVAEGNSARLEATLWGTGIWANDIDWGGSGTIVTGSRNFWGDPAFIAPDTGDYHLGPNSAALDRGIDAGVPDDIDGDLRPNHCFFDIGADERLSGVDCNRLYLPLIVKNR